MVSRSILIAKGDRDGLGRWTTRWVESWLDHQAQGVVMGHTESSWWLGMSPFLRDGHGGRSLLVPSSTTGTMGGRSLPPASGAADRWEGRAAHRRDLPRLEKRANRDWWGLAGTSARSCLWAAAAPCGFPKKAWGIPGGDGRRRPAG